MSSRYSNYPALLGNRLAPITQAVGFLEASFVDVISADRQWRDEIGSYPVRPLVGDLSTILSALLPLTGPVSRYLWLSTEGRWTAYFENFRNGGDPWSPIPHLSRRIGCRGVAIMWAPQTRRAYGGIRFDLYGQPPVDALNYTRTISAINDGGWVSNATGEAQAFEEPEAYRAPHIKNRFGPDMLARYCEALGIRPFDHKYYCRQALVVTNGNLRLPVATETIGEAHARMGIRVQDQEPAV